MEGEWFPLELPLAELQLRFEEPYGAISRFLVVVDSARRALINVVEMATAGVPNMGTSYDITVDDALRISGRAISRRRTHRVRCPYRRSAERSVGQVCVSTCGSRWSQYH